MKDQIPPKFTRRDLILRGAAGVAAFGVGGAFLTVCADKQEQPLLSKLNIKDEATVAQASSSFKALLAEHYGMGVEKEISLSSGLPVTLITDGKIDIDESAFDMAFHLGLENIENLPDGVYKEGMKRIIEGVEKGAFSERKLFLAVSSDPQTCDSPFINGIPFQDPVNSFDYCDGNGKISSIFNVDEYDQGVPPLVIMMYLTAGVDSDGLFRPNNSEFVFNAGESLSVQLSHEALHVYFSLLGIPWNVEAEEAFILQSDRLLNERFQQNPSLRPIPFTFKT